MGGRGGGKEGDVYVHQPVGPKIAITCSLA